MISCLSSTVFASTKKCAHLYLHTEPFSLDPRKGGDRRSQLILRNIFEGLTRLNKDGIPELALAKEVSVSQDQKKYTFILRNTIWSNGDPLTAYDFEYAWKSMLHPSFASPYSYLLFDIKNAQEASQRKCSIEEIGIDALDNTTLQITLSHPAPYFLELVANPCFSPVHSKIDRQTTDWSHASFPQYVSNGPFILKEHLLTSHLILEKNPHYWNPDCAKLQQIHFSIIEEPFTAYALFQKGQLDWYGDPCGIIPLETVSALYQKLTLKPTVSLYWLVCSKNTPELSSQLIRKALSSTINRNELCAFLSGGERPCFSLLPSHIASYSPETRSTSILNPPIITITHWAEPASKSIAEILRQQISASLGVQVHLASYDWSTYIKKLHSGDFMLATASRTLTVHDPYLHLKYIESISHKNTVLSNILLKSKDAVGTHRDSLLKEAEKEATDSYSIIPLYTLVFKYIKNEQLQGAFLSPFGSMELKWLEWSANK